MLKEVTPFEDWIITEKAILIKLELLNKIKQKTVLFLGESPPEGFPKIEIKKITIKRKYKQATSHTKQYDTIKY